MQSPKARRSEVTPTVAMRVPTRFCFDPSSDGTGQVKKTEESTSTGVVSSIDSCIIPGAPDDYVSKLGALIDEVLDAHVAGRPSVGLRVMRAIMSAALQVDGLAKTFVESPERTCGTDEQSAREKVEAHHVRSRAA